MTWAARLAKILAGSALAIATLVGTAQPAAAHADLVKSDPPSGVVLARAPGVVRLSFTEPVDPTFTRVLVRGTVGQTWAAKSMSIDATDNRVLVVAIPALTNGPYAVTWTTTTTDGHTASGDVLLAVGASADFRLVGPATPVGQSTFLRRGGTAARVAWYVSLCALVGGLLWARDRGRRLIRAWAFLTVATVARLGILLASLSAAAPSSSLATIVGRLRPTTAGRAWFVLLDVTLLAGLLVRHGRRRPLLALVGVMCIAEACTGHASVSPHPWLSIPAVSVHLAALAVWGGGLLALIGLPKLTDVGPFLHRFSPWALGSVSALVLTGSLMAWLELGGWHAVTSSGYGHALIIKLLLVGPVLALGLWHWRAGARAVMWFTARLEVALVIAVIAAASVLAASAPGRTATAHAALAASSKPTTAKACTSAVIETSSCWEQYFTYVAQHRGVPTAIGEIKTLSRRDDLVKGECHQLTHTVGRAAFSVLGTAQRALKYSTPLCNSGYQHGVIEEAISRLTADELRTQLPTFCTPINYRPYSFDHHNCTHGVGHGIATHLREDVFASTPYCEVLRDSWETQSCYGGVFMQKVIGDINGASTDAHGNDPVWPCDVVPEVQKDACYLISTGRVLRLNGDDWPKTFAVCDGVEPNHVATCYESIGRDAAGFTLFDPVKMRDICLAAGKLGPEPCLVGAVQTTVDDEHGPTRATALCAVVPDELKDRCRKVRDDALALL